MALGRKTGGGSRKGRPNKVKASTAKALAESGLVPLQYMLRVMRNKAADLERRDDMAKAAAPYVHPRLNSVEATGKDGTPLIPPSSDPLEVARKGRSSRTRRW